MRSFPADAWVLECNLGDAKTHRDWYKEGSGRSNARCDLEQDTHSRDGHKSRGLFEGLADTDGRGRDNVFQGCWVDSEIWDLTIYNRLVINMKVLILVSHQLRWLPLKCAARYHVTVISIQKLLSMSEFFMYARGITHL